MPYVKPGVEITQVEKTLSPVLTTPQLDSIIIGTPFNWIDPNSTESEDAGQTLTIAAEETSPTYDLAALFGVTASDILEDTIVIDLKLATKVTGGVDPGTLIHLHNLATDFTYAAGVVTLLDIARTFTVDGVAHPLLADEVYEVRIGFVSVKPAGFGYKSFSKVSDMEEELGTLKSWNALGFGALLASSNAGTAVKTLGFASDQASVQIPNLDLYDVYAIALMEHNNTNVGTLLAHCESQSLPTNKKERIAFVNYDNSAVLVDVATSSERAIAASAVSINSNGLGSKRVFNVYPDLGFVEEYRHVSTITAAWITASFAGQTSAVNDIYAKLSSTQPGYSGTKYKANTDITSAVWIDLVKAGFGSTGPVKVFVPIPGYYYAAAAAGKAIGGAIEQPMTNSSITGISKTFGSLDMFSETDLNTMAAGGTFIFVQDVPGSPIYCRHQLSTDVLTIQRRELSITRQVDYVAKTFRGVLKNYSGKFNITPNYLTFIKTVLSGLGRNLVNAGVVAKIEVGSVYQDEISPDTTRAQVTVTVKYPANYIKIDLIV